MTMENIGYDCDTNDPQCFSPGTADPFETDYAALVPRFTGGLSAIASALIIYIIFRSETRLSSIYHRIMFGMSLADICGSIAMALTSLPMPSYMPKEEIFGYTWAGTRLGNTYTCNAQGFFSTFGMASVLCFDVVLCVYYACSIAFSMRDEYIKKNLEPIFLGLPIIFGLGFALPPLFLDLYNPTITYFAWCGFWVYPSECLNYDEQECVRGDRDIMVAALYLFFVAVPLNFLIIVISLLLVVIKVIKTDRSLSTVSPTRRDMTNHEIQQILLKNGRTKAVLLQATSYISSFLLAFALPMINALDHLMAVGDNKHNDGFAGGSKVVIDKASLFLFPLQGFFNFIIFVSFKVYNYKRICKQDSICSILFRLFTSSKHDPTFITRISMVQIMPGDKSRVVSGGGSSANVSDEITDVDFSFRIGLMLTNNENSDDVLNGDMEVPKYHGYDEQLPIEKGVVGKDLRLNVLLGNNLPKIDEDVSMSNFESVNSDQQGSKSSGYHYYGSCVEEQKNKDKA